MTIKDWLLFLGPITGFCLSGLLTVFLKRFELQKQREKDERDNLRKNLEAFHSLCFDAVDTVTGLLIRSPRNRTEKIANIDTEVYHPLTSSFTKISSLGALYLPTQPNLSNAAADACRTFMTALAEFHIGRLSEKDLSASGGQVIRSVLKIANAVRLRMSLNGFLPEDETKVLKFEQSALTASVDEGKTKKE